MKKFLIIFFVGILGFAIVYTLVKFPKVFEGANPQSNTDNSDTGIQSLKGFQLSPKSFSGTDFPAFFELNQDLGGTVVGWTGSVRDLSLKGSAPNVVASLAKTYGYKPVFAVQSFSRETGMLLPEFIAAKDDILSFINATDAQYFGLGVEVTELYRKSPSEYKKFVALFADFAKAIHSQSPRTKVFTIFQYEQINGMNGGLFGGKNDPGVTLEKLFDDFPDSDIIGITTYPTLVYKTPEAIPSTYYTKLFVMTSKPVLFTEVGWIRGKSVKGWEGSSTEQRSFLRKFSEQTKDNRVEGYLWSFMYDQTGAQKPFNEMGMSATTIKQESLSEALMFWKQL